MDLGNGGEDSPLKDVEQGARVVDEAAAQQHRWRLTAGASCLVLPATLAVVLLVAAAIRSSSATSLQKEPHKLSDHPGRPKGLPSLQKDTPSTAEKALVEKTPALAEKSPAPAEKIPAHAEKVPAPAETIPVPAEKIPAPAKQMPAPAEECLCLFDIDRTITGKQGVTKACPSNQVFGEVMDNAYAGGTLTLSPLGQNLLSTFCGACRLGIISMGGAGGPQEKEMIAQQTLGGKAGNLWSGPGGPGMNNVTSPLVIGCANPIKAKCAKGIVDWYATEKGVVIPAAEVYFFDDTTGNTNGFADFGFNARQVSCPSREEPIGLCGAQLDEIQRAKGIVNC